MSGPDDTFQLHDLRVDFLCDSPSEDPENRCIMCDAKPGDYFDLRGEMMYLPPGQGVSLSSLAALVPILPAKQLPALHPHDSMSGDAEIPCPNPLCPSVSRMRITRGELRTFRRGEVRWTPAPAPGPVLSGDMGAGGDGRGDGNGNGGDPEDNDIETRNASTGTGTTTIMNETEEEDEGHTQIGPLTCDETGVEGVEIRFQQIQL